MPLKPGYSYDTVMRNVSDMMKAGYAENRAVLVSYSLGRKSFFRAHPGGALPEWLSFPRGHRLRQFYDRNGYPLDMIAIRKNPARRNGAGKREKIAQAARRFKAFTGETDVFARKIKVNQSDSVALLVGPCDGILYSTVRDGVAEKYIHRFAKKSRPLLAASSDGKRLYLLGGAFTFTARGIVDRKR